MLTLTYYPLFDGRCQTNTVGISKPADAPSPLQEIGNRLILCSIDMQRVQVPTTAWRSIAGGSEGLHYGFLSASRTRRQSWIDGRRIEGLFTNAARVVDERNRRRFLDRRYPGP